MFQVKTGASDIKHLIVTNGRAMIKSKKQSLVLKKGETTIISEKDSINLENPGKEPLSIVQVLLFTH
jgi:mannose-6-phosphate isomerase-like protein (cupin superfamily)